MKAPSTIPKSGTRIDLQAASSTASIASTGASLRDLSVDGRPLVVSYDPTAIRPGFRGATLVPWPNRVIDGRYLFDGVERQLALTEPSRGHALHGLGVWRDWRIVDHTETSARLALQIEPSDGYPWRLEVETTYSLAEGSLTQEVSVTNLDDEVAPWGTGPHPYLVAGSSSLETWTLELPADVVQTVTDDRLEPIALEPVTIDAQRFDFRTPRALGDARIDHAFTELARDDVGLASVTLRDPEGTGVAMQWDDGCPWVQIHTADLPHGDRALGHRAGLAVEPMTCAPGAMDKRREAIAPGLIRLAPGGTHRASWTIRAA